MASVRPSLYGVVLGCGLLCSCAGSDAPSGRSSPPIRVGTSGTTPPYSQRVDTSFVGIDIDLARDLGDFMGRRVEFVAVSWPTLLSDLAQHRFDVAMGGIYVTREREVAGLFSAPYLRVSQLAIVRCTDVGRFASLADANRPSVRVLHTVGGANQDFIHRNLPNVTFVPIGPDPRETARKVAEGEGDLVFFTSLGAQYLTQRDPRICIGFGRATFNEELAIAALMPRESRLHAPINRWVHLRREDGLIDRVVERHLDGP